MNRPAAPLSERESDVLRLIASGYSNKGDCRAALTERQTVEAHKANAMRKLRLNRRIDIVKYAVLQGWLDKTRGTHAGLPLKANVTVKNAGPTPTGRPAE